MLAAFLMGLVGGQRSMVPLAAVCLAAAWGKLPVDNGAPPIIAHPLAAAGAVALAIGELAGDKLKTAPDRTVPIGLAARFMTSALAGAALVPSRQRWLGAAVGGATAVMAAYPGRRARVAAMRLSGPTSAGLVEDAAVLLSTVAILRTLGRTRARGLPSR